MKCPNCGTEIGDDMLYCENCGEDIHIVPDFEPEIEYSLHNTLSGIVKDVLEEKTEASLEEDVLPKQRLRKGAVIAIAAVLAAILTVTVIFSVKLHKENSAGHQIAKANECISAGNFEEAIVYYEKAVTLDAGNVSLRLTLADLYEKAGMEQQFVSCITSVMATTGISEDEKVTAYKKLINYYKNRKEYTAINTLLINTEDENIRTMFQSYMAAAPEFSYKEGTYAEVVPLKLTSSIQGTIYYTTDGTIPTTDSQVYTTPVFLETGQYTVSAMFVNAYGIASEVVAKTYVIDIKKPAAPEVETYSGEYESPVMITVQVPTGCTVYYTSDGTNPTDQSTVYVGEIPMPLGKSTFKFVTYNKEGVAGDYTIRQYELTLDTENTVEMALEKINAAMILVGKTTDMYGTIAGDLTGKYVYRFQYALAIPKQGDFYVISEIYEDSAGIQNKTGITYAVNVYTMEYYKLSKDALDNYVLEAF